MKNFYWLNNESRLFLSRGYLEEGVTPEQRIRNIADNAERISGIQGFSDKFYNYMAKGWISLASPIWSNYGMARGLPISCFGSYVPDDTAQILSTASEAGMMSKTGGGTSAYFGALRPRGSAISAGGKSNGAISFMEIFETITNTISQNGIRRGNMAIYMPVEHGDIDEFLAVRGEGHPIQNLSIGVTVGDEFMQGMIDGDEEKQRVWAKVLKKRSESGYPYIMFKDTANNNGPQVYKDKNKSIEASNLCSEIMLSSDEIESFVCCLSSVNLYHYEDWKDSDLVDTMCIFLDTVLTEFIDKASTIPHLERAVTFARNQRAIGIGVLGLHSYLQKKNIAMEGLEVKMELNKIFKNISDLAKESSKRLAELWGEPPLLKGYGERFVTTMAIAPTTSSSFILGQISPSIEPLNSNYFLKDVAKVKTAFKNPELKRLLEAKGEDNLETWRSILTRGGSVQHLDFLSEHEKNVFKTFQEINQKELVINVSIMQKYVDQGISFNTTIDGEESVKNINKLMIEAWQLGVKAFYYQNGVNLAQQVSRGFACGSCEA